MRSIYAMGHHYGGYDGDDYEELHEYKEELMEKLDEICDKIDNHPEHHGRGGYSSNRRGGSYSSNYRDDDGYDMYDEGHRRGRSGRGRRSGEHYVRGHYSR